MGAILTGRRVVIWLAFIVGLCWWAFSSLNNALHYTEADAKVDRIEEVCVPVGAPIKTAINCGEAQTNPGRNRLAHHTAVYVRYQSPADGKEYGGFVIPMGGPKAVEAIHLRPGDPWKILVHNDDPNNIKAE